MSHAGSSDLPRRVRTLFGSGVVAGLSDAELLERFRAQRATAEDAVLAAEAAFAALVARHGPMVLGVCRRALDDPNDVDDAFQATFLVLVRQAHSVRVGDSLGRWLYGVARRVAAKAQARSHRDRVRTTPLEDDPVASSDPAARLGLLAALDEEVNRLPEKYRAPVVLCHLEGLTHAEAADRLRWPIGTVSGRLSRARDLLRDRLVRRGIVPAAALLTSETARAAVPESLAAATVRAATRLAIGGASPAGAVSASALALMNAVLRAAAVSKLKVAAAVLLVIAAAGAALGAGARAGGLGVVVRASHPNTVRTPAIAPAPASNPADGHRPADELVREIEAARAAAEELLLINDVDLRLMPKVKDLSALPTSGRNLIIVAELNRSLYLRMFDVHAKMVLDSDATRLTARFVDAKRFTTTWVEALQQWVPTMWPPHELTHVERISVIDAVRQLAGTDWRADMQRAHGRIFSLVGELRAAYPHDPRLAHYLPDRWDSSTWIGQSAVIGPELREILETTRNPALRTDALYFQTLIRLQQPIDGRAATSLAESFAAQALGDKRAAELLFRASHKLSAQWFTLVTLAAVFAVTAGLVAATIGMRRWLKYAVRVGVVLLALFAVVVAVSFFLANDVLIATLQHVDVKIRGGSAAAALFLSQWLGPGPFAQLRALAGTLGAAVVVTLAALSGVLVVVARRRFAQPPTRWLSAIRLGLLTFFAVLAACCAIDACLIGLQRNAIRARIVRDYPDSSPGQKIQQQRVGGQFGRDVENLGAMIVVQSGSSREACPGTPLPPWERSPVQRAGEGAELPTTHAWVASEFTATS